MRWFLAMSRCATLPKPIPGEEPSRTFRVLYDQALEEAGVEGTVLVRLNINERGEVTRAKAIRPPRIPFGKGVAVLRDSQTGETRHALPHSMHPRLREIAEAAARATTFSPGEHRGRPIPITGFRMSFGFRVPTASSGPGTQDP